MKKYLLIIPFLFLFFSTAKASVVWTYAPPAPAVNPSTNQYEFHIPGSTGNIYICSITSCTNKTVGTVISAGLTGGHLKSLSMQVLENRSAGPHSCGFYVEAHDASGTLLDTSSNVLYTWASGNTTGNFLTANFNSTSLVANVSYFHLVDSGVGSSCVSGNSINFTGNNLASVWSIWSGMSSASNSHIDPAITLNSDNGTFLTFGVPPDGSTLTDFNNWNFLYTVDPLLFTGIRNEHITVTDNVGPQTDTLAGFTSDFFAGTNSGVIRMHKGITLAVGQHTLTANLVDDTSGTTIASAPSINITIIAGTATDQPLPIITVTPPNQPNVICNSGNIFSDAFCATINFVFIPTGGYQAYFSGKIQGIKDTMFTYAPFAYFTSLSASAEQTGLTQGDPSATMAIATPLAGGTTFNLTALDTTNSLMTTLHGTALRTWISTFLWLSFATYLLFRGFNLFRNI